MIFLTTHTLLFMRQSNKSLYDILLLDQSIFWLFFSPLQYKKCQIYPHPLFPWWWRTPVFKILSRAWGVFSQLSLSLSLKYQLGSVAGLTSRMLNYMKTCTTASKCTVRMRTNVPCTVGWSDFALFDIFKNITADQVFVLKFGHAHGRWHVRLSV